MAFDVALARSVNSMQAVAPASRACWLKAATQLLA
jgi:hypothetical protein